MARKARGAKRKPAPKRNPKLALAKALALLPEQMVADVEAKLAEIDKKRPHIAKRPGLVALVLTREFAGRGKKYGLTDEQCEMIIEAIFAAIAMFMS